MAVTRHYSGILRTGKAYAFRIIAVRSSGRSGAVTAEAMGAVLGIAAMGFVKIIIAGGG